MTDPYIYISQCATNERGPSTGQWWVILAISNDDLAQDGYVKDISFYTSPTTATVTYLTPEPENLHITIPAAGTVTLEFLVEVPEVLSELGDSVCYVSITDNNNHQNGDACSVYPW